MSAETLNKAITLANKLQHLFIATADRKGVPHLAAAAALNPVDKNHVAVSAWFCPTTVSNLHHNPLISLVIWDRKTDTGYQLVGKSEKVEEIAMLDGYAPGIDERVRIPQVERRVVVRIDKIIDFKHAPHTDVEE